MLTERATAMIFYYKITFCYTSEMLFIIYGYVVFSYSVLGLN